MATNQYIYIGKGSMSLKLNGGPRRRIGNASKLQLAVETEKKNLPDYESAGGGNVQSIERITSVNAAVTAHDLSPENLAVATRGLVSVYAGGAVSDEAHDEIFIDGLIVLDHIQDMDEVLTVTHTETAVWAATTAYDLGDKIVDGGHLYVVTVAGTTGASEPTWPTDGSTVTDGSVTWDDLGTTSLTEDVDYTRVRAGIIPLGGKLANGDAGIKASYTGLADSIVQALVDSGQEFELFFDGLNEANSGKAVQVTLFKSKPSPSSIDFIADDYAGLELNFEVVKDSTKNGTTASQYYTIKSVTA
jgi:hypothetical protein